MVRAMTARRSRATREPPEAPKTARAKPESAGRADGAAVDDPPPFEEGLERLERLVGELEGGELPLERALGAFEEGVGLARELDRQLDQAEQRVEVLLREGGRWTTEPLDADSEDPRAPDERDKEA